MIVACSPQVKLENRRYKTNGKWDSNEWRVIKKSCCLAEVAITSDTNVILASSWTSMPLCTRQRGECMAVTLSFTPLNLIVNLLFSSFPTGPLFSTCIKTSYTVHPPPFLSDVLSAHAWKQKVCCSLSLSLNFLTSQKPFPQFPIISSSQWCCVLCPPKLLPSF